MIDTPTMAEEESDSKKELKTLEGVNSSLEFKDVSFGYNSEKMVLEKLNFKIAKGQKIALVGNSGGGKTTVCSLIPRLYEICSGQILIDGCDIRDFSIESLRKNISVVFQDNFLFTGTIRQNILMGNLAKLPQGIDTPIGEKGILLSGGQKQRVAIARAFIKNAPLVILDEATSALDNKSEKIVQEALDNLMKNKTVIVIAHRLSTIIDSDKIMVINDGQIVESGSHDELLASDGAYSALYKSQFKKTSEQS